MLAESVKDFAFVCVAEPDLKGNCCANNYLFSWILYFCIHFIVLYSRLEEHTTPEIFRTPLHEISLSIKLLHLGQIGDFLAKAIEPPPMDAVIESEVVLRGLLRSFLYYYY